jgi:hypothetical protein
LEMVAHSSFLAVLLWRAIPPDYSILIAPASSRKESLTRSTLSGILTVEKFRPRAANMLSPGGLPGHMQASMASEAKDPMEARLLICGAEYLIYS